MHFIHKTEKMVCCQRLTNIYSSQSVLLQNIVCILSKVRLNGKKTGFEAKMHNFLVNHVSLHETVAFSFRETEESQRNLLRAHFVCS